MTHSLAVPTFLRQWRDYRHLTQEELADKAGLTAPSISQLENGIQGFTDKSLAELATALGCTPVELLGRDPSVKDDFWPVLQAVERLPGPARQQVYNVLIAMLGPVRGGSE